ncbi:hypothetical protein O3P69_003502 [Scylla paramamosain]|uniref:Uncharacterized protein n=1 Tax=Scylla paramamosain TaxID=85552 RepID=A0AAW0UI01_SCYPA
MEESGEAAPPLNTQTEGTGGGVVGSVSWPFLIPLKEWRASCRQSDCHTHLPAGVYYLKHSTQRPANPGRQSNHPRPSISPRSAGQVAGCPPPPLPSPERECKPGWMARSIQSALTRLRGEIFFSEKWNCPWIGSSIINDTPQQRPRDGERTRHTHSRSLGSQQFGVSLEGAYTDKDWLRLKEGKMEHLTGYTRYNRQVIYVASRLTDCSTPSFSITHTGVSACYYIGPASPASPPPLHQSG